MNFNQCCPKTWLVESIIVTIFCCLPFGIAGIVFAARVNTLYLLGKTEEAIQASEDAKKWTIIGAILGGVGIVLYVIIATAGLIAL